MRQLDQVIDQMLAEIPQEEKDLREGLEHVKYKCGYRAPEMAKESWTEAAWMLADRFGGEDPDSDWGKKIQAIWLGKPKGE